MEILDLRLLPPGDLKPLLEEENHLWQQKLQWDFSPTVVWMLRMMEMKALSGYVAVERGHARGYSYFFVSDQYDGRFKGLVGGVFVSGQSSNGDTGDRLILHTLETLQAMPGVQRIEAQMLLSTSEQIRQRFRLHDFRNYRRKFLCFQLNQESVALPELPPATAIVSWESHRFAEAAALINRAYHGHVDSEINDQYRSLPGISRFLENIVQHSGCGVFQPEYSFFAISDQQNAPCAMILTSKVHDRVAHITQLCVEPSFHGKGIGSYLLVLVLQKLRQEEFSAVTLTVTATNNHALNLYKKFQFKNLTDFDAFVWEAGASGSQ
ncbi:MAG: hypothetical protein A3F68_02155 [Acidobacteria bacterium RIFCSPLOWO2_12_FULL_54_10]|nr:MAG: hypothetical protein A3F68_02155 [Acidobacteria bacterium RIFCSPLOWO2_12_FULL_54_10]